jgi:quinone-modifying oxidoreductase, subunit QmoA
MKNLNVLVVGAGISGITCALEIAEVGHHVILVEKKEYIGGRVIQMNRYFPKLCPPYCGMEINFQRLKKNSRIQVYTNSNVIEIRGTKGDFQVLIEQAAQYVNENCTACGKCSAVCPVELDNTYNYGLNKRKAISLPHELAFPYRYHLYEKCLKEKCAKCLDVCEYQAIDFSAQVQKREFRVHSIVIATGWKAYDVSEIKNMAYQLSPDIISNVEMERISAENGPGSGKILKPSNGEIPRKIAFVQCAGSRDQNYLSYCSGVCCSASIKQALLLREKIPEASIDIFYIDLRLSGRNESVLKKAENDPMIRMIKSKVAQIEYSHNDHSAEIHYEDIEAGKKTKGKYDLVVLASGIVPEAFDPLKKHCNENGFLLEDQLTNGIYAIGSARSPMDVSASLKDATGKALLALQL